MLRLKRTIDDLLKDGAAIDRAIREGVRAALLRHQKLGQPIVVLRDGKVVTVPPEKIADELNAAAGNESPAP